MSDIGEPVDMRAAVIKRVDELVGDHPAHVSLVADVILTQNNLEDTKIKEVCSFLNPALSVDPTFSHTQTPAGSLHSPLSPFPPGHASHSYQGCVQMRPLS